MGEEKVFSREDVDKWFEWFNKQKPGIVHKEINEGDFLRKGTDYLIHVDSFKKVIENFSWGTGKDINIKKIRTHFTQHHTNRYSENKYYDQYYTSKRNGYKIVTLSQLIDNQVGECTEMSIIFQIMSQSLGRDSYWINPAAISLKQEEEEEGITRLQYHAFNVAFKNGLPYVIDVALKQILQILDIVNDQGDIEIIVEEKSFVKYFLS